MASIYGIERKDAKLAVVRSINSPIVTMEDLAYSIDPRNTTLLKFNDFWNLMDTIKQHAYLRAAMSVVGRSAVGAWWSLRRHPEYGKSAPDRHRKRLFAFYNYKDKRWNNIKDYQNLAYKLMIATMYLRYFGQAAFSIVRDKNGAPLGLDFLHGFVIPNVDIKGNFKSPAFVQYPTRNPGIHEDFADPRDIVYLVNPDWEGSPMGASDIEALGEFTLPIDIYLQVAAREYLKNRDTPEVVYSLPSDISDEAFDAFVKEMETRRRGPSNLGKNPIAIQGEFEVHELSKLPDSLPYQDSRKDAREETLAVAGVNGAKMGLSESLASANLREMRREFHETNLIPLFRLVEIALYEQVHVREFGMDGWEFSFNSPDFLNAVERATVHMRYHDMGVLNPNEIRTELNRPERSDEYGDKYVDEVDAEKSKQQAEAQAQQQQQQPNSNKPGSPPEGRPVEPDDPSQTGEPTNDDQDPPRGDQHDEQAKENILDELNLWKKFAIRRMKNGKRLRDFHAEYIPEGLKGIVQQYVNSASTVDELAEMFDVVINDFKKEW